MAGLADHFGEDASPPSSRPRSNHLVQNAGQGNGTKLRITEQRWFRHGTTSRTGCGRSPRSLPGELRGLHRQAEQGIYEEED
jgi:hypothetical protein